MVTCLNHNHPFWADMSSGQITNWEGTTVRACTMVRPMGNNLKTLRERRGWTVEAAANAMGLSKSGYEKIENGDRRLTLERISRAAQIYQVPESEVISSRVETYVVGEVLRGGVVKLFGEDAPKRAVAPSPFDASLDTVALLVADGDALPGVAEERWYVYHGQRHEGLPDEWVGDLCVIALSPAEVVIRRAYHGRERGTYDIVSLGHEPRRGVTILWSSKIEWIKPR